MHNRIFPPRQEEREEEVRDRKPILLNRYTVALIFLYKREGGFDEMCLSDYEAQDMIELQKKAAKEFIDQLEDEWCLDFMKTLRDEINTRIDKGLYEPKTAD